MEYEAVDEGVIAKMVVPEGTADMPVNQPIAVLAAEGEDVKAAAAGAPAAKPAPASAAAPSPTPAPTPPHQPQQSRGGRAGSARRPLGAAPAPAAPPTAMPAASSPRRSRDVLPRRPAST